MSNKESTILLNAEELINLINKEEWIDFYENVIENQEDFLVDNDLIQILELFESRYLSSTHSLNRSELNKYKDIDFRIERNPKLHSNQFRQKLITRRVKAMIKYSSVNDVLNFGASRQNNPEVQSFINKYKKQAPEKIFDMSHPNISIKSTPLSNNVSAAKPIFNSPQERIFWEAIRDSFPLHYPLANMPLSQVLDSNIVKSKLGAKEMDYFFKATVDNVVIDNLSDMTPIFYFELDSGFHDNHDVRRKDRIKDKIFEVANVKFLRIRHKNPHLATKEEFKQLALEILK